MKGSTVERAEVTPSNAPSGAPHYSLVAIDSALLARLMKPDKLNIKSPELARATGRSPGYVRQVRTGKRPYVSRAFMRAAEIYLGARIGREDVPVGVLLAKE